MKRRPAPVAATPGDVAATVEKRPEPATPPIAPTPPDAPASSAGAAASGTPTRASFINRRSSGGLFRSSTAGRRRNLVTGSSRSRVGRPSLIGSTY